MKGCVAVARVDMGKEWGAVHARDVSGAWGHVDEAQNVWAGLGGSWAAVQHVAWAWHAGVHGTSVEMSLEAVKCQAWARFTQGSWV